MTDLLDGLDEAERKALAIVACAHWLPQSAIEAAFSHEIVPALPELLRLGLVLETSAGALTVPASLRDELLSDGFGREMLFAISARLAPLFQGDNSESRIESCYHQLAVDPVAAGRRMFQLALTWASEPLYAFTELQRLIDVWQEFEKRWGLTGQAAAYLGFAKLLGTALSKEPEEELAMIEGLDWPDDPLFVAQADLRIGQLLTTLNKNEKAGAALTRAYGKFESIGHGIGYVQAGRALGRLFAKIDQYGEARTCHERALEQSLTLGLPIASAQCLQGLAEIDTFTGDLDRANERYNQAITILDAYGGRTAEAFTRLLLSQVLTMRGDLKSASDHIDLAKQVYDLLGKPLQQANCLRFEAAVDLEAGKPGPAREKSAAALAEYQRLKTNTGLAACKEIAGQVDMVEGNFTAASSLLREAAAQFEQDSDRFGAASCLRDLGVLALLQEDLGKATELLVRSAAQFEEIGALLERAFARVMLSAADPTVTADDDRRKLVKEGVGLPRAYQQAWSTTTGTDWASGA